MGLSPKVGNVLVNSDTKEKSNIIINFKIMGMKHLFIYLLLFFLIAYPYGCEEQKEAPRLQHDLEKSLFNELTLNQNEDKVIENLSQISRNLNIYSLRIKDLDNNALSFNVKSGKLFINGLLYDINDEVFQIKKEEGLFYIKNRDSNIQIIYCKDSNSFIIEESSKQTKLEDLKIEDVTARLENEFVVNLVLLHEFIIPHSDNELKSTYGIQEFCGVGVGFHLGLADAEHFCEEDYNRILEEHPGWWSPGISYSCAFGEHLCMCTANFYC